MRRREGTAQRSQPSGHRHGSGAPARAAASASDVAWTLCMLVLGAVVAGAGALIWRSQVGGSFALDRIAEHSVPRSLGDLENVLALAFCAIGLLTLLWWALSMTAAFACALLLRLHKPRSARLVARWTPAYMRRLAVALLGVQLIAAPAAFAADMPTDPGDGGPAVSAEAAPSPAWSALDPAEPAPSPVWQPAAPGPQLDRVVDATLLAGTTTPVSSEAERSGESAPSPAWNPGRSTPEIDRVLGSTRPSSDEVVVTAGDTLWSIAANALGPDATAAEIAAEWPRWHDANRDVIGDDPDRLAVGSVLTPPSDSPIS